MKRINSVFAPSMLTLSAALAMVIVFCAGAAVHAKRQKHYEIYGLALPEAVEKLQEYRDSASFMLMAKPEATARQIVESVGGSSRVKQYKSVVGSTVLIFIRDMADREPWSMIQVSGTVNTPGCIIVVTRERGETGWHWKKSGGHWDYR